MPPFGKNVHIDMTSWLPTGTDQAQAVNTDKNYELAFLYAEYRGGQDQSWENYVSPVMKTGVQQSLQATDVTTESFTGTIKYFDMSVIPDPLVKVAVLPFGRKSIAPVPDVSVGDQLMMLLLLLTVIVSMPGVARS